MNETTNTTTDTAEIIQALVPVVLQLLDQGEKKRRADAHRFDHRVLAELIFRDMLSHHVPIAFVTKDEHGQLEAHTASAEQLADLAEVAHDAAAAFLRASALRQTPFATQERGVLQQ